MSENTYCNKTNQEQKIVDGQGNSQYVPSGMCASISKSQTNMIVTDENVVKIGENTNEIEVKGKNTNVETKTIASKEVKEESQTTQEIKEPPQPEKTRDNFEKSYSIIFIALLLVGLLVVKVVLFFRNGNYED